MENDEEDGFTEVLAHSIDGDPYRDEDGFWILPMVVEEDGKVFTADVPFMDKDSILSMQKYFRSPKGFEPVRFII